MMKIKLIKLIIVILTLFILFPSVVYALQEESDNISSQLENYDFSMFEKAVITRGNQATKDINVKNMVVQAITGELGVSPLQIATTLLKSLFLEVSELIYLMQHMVIIAVLSAIFTNISSSFKSKSVSELGFYVNYVVVVALLTSSFAVCAGIMNSFISDICGIIEAATPLMLSVATFAGSGVKAAVLSPMLLAATGFISVTVDRYIMPLILMAAVLQTVNYLTERELLRLFSDLIKKFVGWGMGLTAALFMGVISLQGISAPILNNAAIKTAKFAVNAIPVVGSAFSSAVDTVFYWSSAVRSGFLVAIIIILILICAIPIIKIAAFILVYKVTAAIIQPICDPRIVKAIDGIGGLAGLMLGACAIVAIMFIFMAMIMLSS